MLDPATVGNEAEELFVQRDTGATSTVISDILEAAASTITAYDLTGIIYTVVDALNVPAADLVLRIADNIRIRNAAMIATPFLRWIRDNDDPALTEIREFLLTKLTTHESVHPSRSWLQAMVERNAVDLGSPALIYGFNRAWEMYLLVIDQKGTASTITYQEQYRVLYTWPDGHAEGSDHAGTMERREAEGLAFRHNNQGRPSTAVPQSRTIIKGCWTNIPQPSDDDPYGRRPIIDGPHVGNARRTISVRPFLDGPEVTGER